MDFKTEITTFKKQTDAIREEWREFNKRRKGRGREFVSRELQVLRDIQQLLTSALRGLEKLH